MLGRAVGASLERLDSGQFQRDAALAGVLSAVELPARSVPAVADAERTVVQYRQDFERLKAEKAEPARVRTAECAVFGAEGTLTLARLDQAGEIARTLQSYRPIEVQAVRIGDGCLVGLPGELFTEYALEIKRGWPDKVFVVSLVNGHLQGYIVTREAAERGGYEALSSVLDGPPAGEELVRAASELLAELAPRQSGT